MESENLLKSKQDTNRSMKLEIRQLSHMYVQGSHRGGSVGLDAL